MFIARYKTESRVVCQISDPAHVQPIDRWSQNRDGTKFLNIALVMGVMSLISPRDSIDSEALRGYFNRKILQWKG